MSARCLTRREVVRGFETGALSFDSRGKLLYKGRRVVNNNTGSESRDIELNVTISGDETTIVYPFHENVITKLIDNEVWEMSVSSFQSLEPLKIEIDHSGLMKIQGGLMKLDLRLWDESVVPPVISRQQTYTFYLFSEGDFIHNIAGEKFDVVTNNDDATISVKFNDLGTSRIHRNPNEIVWYYDLPIMETWYGKDFDDYTNAYKFTTNYLYRGSKSILLKGNNTDLCEGYDADRYNGCGTIIINDRIFRSLSFENKKMRTTVYRYYWNKALTTVRLFVGADSSEKYSLRENMITVSNRDNSDKLWAEKKNEGALYFWSGDPPDDRLNRVFYDGKNICFYKDSNAEHIYILRDFDGAYVEEVNTHEYYNNDANYPQYIVIDK